MKKRGVGFLCFMLVLSACSINQKNSSLVAALVSDIETMQDELDTVAQEVVIYEASFIAAGDNLIHEAIYLYNSNGDGTYNFAYMYEPTKDLIESVDYAYLNFETICAGEEIGLSGYPTFNGPTDMIDTVVSVGFDWLSGASNHSYDKGEAGILAQIEYIETNFPDITLTGMHASQEDADTYTIVEVNGIKIGLLDYTYGLNGFTLPEGKEYLVDLIDEDKIIEDMVALVEISDIQIVSMHWGQEYVFYPNSTQQSLAQLLSDLGADVIIGTHPHVIQEMTFIEGEDGNETLVMYSLGNYLSGQSYNYRMLGALGKWSIEYNAYTGEVTFKDVEFIPTVTQIEDNYQTYYTYTLEDWTDEMGKNHSVYLVEGQEMTREYFISIVEDVMADADERIQVTY